MHYIRTSLFLIVIASSSHAAKGPEKSLRYMCSLTNDAQVDGQRMNVQPENVPLDINIYGKGPNRTSAIGLRLNGSAQNLYVGSIFVAKRTDGDEPSVRDYSTKDQINLLSLPIAGMPRRDEVKFNKITGYLNWSIEQRIREGLLVSKIQGPCKPL